jgi:hypothetical protein
MVQSFAGEQPEQPSHGAEQPPHDLAQPSGEQPGGQQPYHEQPRLPYPPPPDGTGGGYGPPPVKRGNAFAYAGIILAVFFPILGLIFSVIGLTKSKARAGVGKTVSIVGIVVSLLVGSGATVLAVAIVSHLSAEDPGCITAESDLLHMDNRLIADKAAISQDQNNPSAKQTDTQHILTDMQSLQRQLTTAVPRATHQSVKAELLAMISDINTYTSSWQAAENGDTSQINQVTNAAYNLQSDGHALDKTCSSFPHSPPGAGNTTALSHFR